MTPKKPPQDKVAGKGFVCLKNHPLLVNKTTGQLYCKVCDKETNVQIKEPRTR